MEAELNWLAHLIEIRISRLGGYLAGKSSHFPIPSDSRLASDLLSLPPLDSQKDSYAQFCKDFQLSPMERLLLILCLANHVDSGLLTHVFQNGGQEGCFLPWVGLNRSPGFQGVIPTGLTFAFLWGGQDQQGRMEAMGLFTQLTVLAEKDIIRLLPSLQGAPMGSGALVMVEKWVEYFTVEVFKGEFSSIKYYDHRPPTKLNENGTSSEAKQNA